MNERCSSKKKCVFVDWYESTGELLGEGAFGHVTTYRHNRTKTEFAVKVILLQQYFPSNKVTKDADT